MTLPDRFSPTGKSGSDRHPGGGSTSRLRLIGLVAIVFGAVLVVSQLIELFINRMLRPGSRGVDLDQRGLPDRGAAGRDDAVGAGSDWLELLSQTWSVNG